LIEKHKIVGAKCLDRTAEESVFSLLFLWDMVGHVTTLCRPHLACEPDVVHHWFNEKQLCYMISVVKLFRLAALSVEGTVCCFRLHRMHEMQTVVTDVHRVCPSVCLSVSLFVMRLNCVWCIHAAFAKLLWPLVYLLSTFSHSLLMSNHHSALLLLLSVRDLQAGEEWAALYAIPANSD